MKKQTYSKKLIGFFISGIMILMCISFAQAQDLPAPWANTDIGSVLTAGSATFEEDVFTIEASGADIWNAADEFHYVYQRAVGDCDITAYVEYVKASSSDAKACLMVRETLDAGSAMAMAVTCYGPEHGTYFQIRPITDEDAVHHTNLDHGHPAPVWIRLVREGDMFSAFYADDTTNWLTKADPVSITMTADTVYIGLGFCNKGDDVLGEVTFANVKVNPGIEYTGINELTVNKLSVYPNLVTDFLTIEISEKMYYGNNQISIFNSLGQSVREIEATSNKILLDLSDIPQGIYFISLITDKGNIVKRIIKK